MWMDRLLHLRLEKSSAKIHLSCILKKAFADIDGAYPMINQQFVQHECTGYQYVNREDDAGSEGLRKSKIIISSGISGRKRNPDEKECVGQ